MRPRARAKGMRADERTGAVQQTVTQPQPVGLPRLGLGRFAVAVFADCPDNPAIALRGLCFRNGADDRDALDSRCLHAAVTAPDGTVVAAFRLLLLGATDDLSASYSARFYDLARLSARKGPALELGRFCLHPAWHDPDILRLAWAALTRLVDAHGVALLFGCSSFAGTDPAPYVDALAQLARAHQAPPALAPARKAAAFDYPAATARHSPDPRAAAAAMPPLLRTYLGMGGWVSDHAVIDRDLDTLHVFTAVEIARIPAPRTRLLRALADSVQVLHD